MIHKIPLRLFSCTVRACRLDLAHEKHVLKIDLVHDLPLQHVVHLSNQTYKSHQPPDPAKSPVVLLHGLFGAKQNYNSVGRRIAAATKRKVIGLDLRNHGTSPHVAPFDYQHMTYDVIEYLDHIQHPVMLAGHLMGAKVAMMVTLVRPDLVQKLVVIDNSPVCEPLGSQFENDLVGMCHVERDHSLRNLLPTALIPKVDSELAKFEKDSLVRVFLMSNLMKRRSRHDELPVRFRIPVFNFLKHDVLEKLGHWPDMGSSKFHRPVLVMRGLYSNFVTEEHLSSFSKYFSDVSVVNFESGHWLVSEQPERFVEEFTAFTEREEKTDDLTLDNGPDEFGTLEEQTGTKLESRAEGTELH